MNSRVPDCHRFAVLKPLLWINLLGAGSVAIFCALGMIDLKFAKANPPKQQVVSGEQNRTDTQSETGLDNDKRSQTPSENPSVESTPSAGVTKNPPTPITQKSSAQITKPIKSEVATVAPPEFDVALETSTVLPHEPPKSVVQAESQPVTSPKSAVVAVTPEANPTQLVEEPGQRAIANPTNETTLTQHSYTNNKQPTTNNQQPTTLAQLPSLPPLPVPPNPIPSRSGNSNSTVGQLPAFPQTPLSPQGFPTNIPVGTNNYNPQWGQYPTYPQPQPTLPVSPTMIPVGTNNYNPGWGQYPNYPQTVIVMPMQATGGVTNFNPYNPVAGQFPSVPQTIILVPVPVTGMPTGVNPYNPGWGQYPSVSQPPQSWPIPPTQNPVGFNSYNPQVGQPAYYPQTQTPLPPPLNSNPVGFNSYNPGVGQGVYYPQTQTPFPPPLNSNQVGFNSYNPGVGQGVYYPQTQTPLPPPLNSNPVGTDSYNPGWGQYPVYQQNAPVPPGFINSNPVQPNGYNPIVGQSPYPAQLPSILPNAVPPNTQFGQLEPNQPASLLRSTALRSPSLQAQGAYVVQGESSVARARLSGLYPLTPNVVFGATLDLTSEDSGLADSPNQGLNINELFFATAPFDNLPNLRFVVGQLDLTSYFDRNSFAKDGVTHFFNPAFQTNPALSATGIASKPAFLVNWTLNDSIEAKAAAFSSARNIGDFALDGFAGEIAFRYGNAIVRGTYATDRDAGSETGFQEIFSIPRGDNGEVGLESGDREEAYGLNAEYFVPDWNMGVFARYGRYINREIDEAATTYSFGVSFLDVFLEDDRLGLGYGQNLSNNQGQEKPDVLELFYDFRFLPNLRLGFTLQQRNGFTETDVGVRVKTDFDVIPTNN